MRKSLFVTLFLLFLFEASYCQNINLDSLEKSIPQVTNDTQKIELFNNLGYEYRHTSIDKSFEYTRKALKLSNKISYKPGEVRSLVLLGIINKNIGNYDEAIRYQLKALTIAEDINNEGQISICLTNIGNIYQIQENYPNALDYYNQSLKIEDKLNNKEQKSIRLYNIGTIYELTDSLDKAYSFYYNSLIIEQELKNNEGIFYALYGIAGVDIKKQDYVGAEKNLNQAMDIARKMNDIAAIALCYNELGKLYRGKGQYKKAIEQFNLCIKYADSLSYLSDIKGAYFELSATYEAIGDYKNAYQYLNNYVILNDSINNIEISSKIADLASKYKIDKKEQEIKYLEEQQKLEQEKSKTEKKNRYFLFISLILALALTLSNLGRVLKSPKLIFLYTGTVIILMIIGSLLIYYMGDYPDHPLGLVLLKIFVDVMTYTILPIFIFVLIAERVLYSKRLKKAKNLSEQIKKIQVTDINRDVTLMAENKKTSITVSLKELLCVEASDNYSIVYYTKDNEVRREILRQTLKNIEQQLESLKEITRCHKSYIVNYLNIEKLTGNAQGYKLIVKSLDFTVPVSRKFPKEMIEKLKSL